MSKYLKTVTLDGLHFGVEGKGGSYGPVALPQAVEPDAYGERWDTETLTLSYLVPNPPDTEGNPVSPTEASITLTQAEVDDAETALSTPDIDKVKEYKAEELRKQRNADWQGELMTSFGVPFNTDIQTQMDIQLMIQRLALDTDVFTGYKCADGVRRDLTKAQFALALTEGVDRKVAAFAHEGVKTAELESATTVAEVRAITW